MCSGKKSEENEIQQHSSDDPGDKYFHNRDIFIWKFATQWLKAKRINDECEGLWRIHDDGLLVVEILPSTIFSCSVVYIVHYLPQSIEAPGV